MTLKEIADRIEAQFPEEAAFLRSIGRQSDTKRLAVKAAAKRYYMALRARAIPKPAALAETIDKFPELTPNVIEHVIEGRYDRIIRKNQILDSLGDTD